MKRARTYKLYRETKTRAINITASLVMVASSIIGASPLLFNGSASAAATVVTPTSSQGWTGIDDNGNGGSLTYVNGPGTPPLGSGSAQLAVNATNQGYLLAKSAYGGTKLSDINTLTYHTYVQTGDNTIAPSVQLNITSDVNAAATWQGRLVYEPYMNGTVTDGTWQSWDAKAGKWWLTKPSAFGNNCAQISPCTFAELVALYPNIGINTGALQGVGFKAGSSWSSFVGNVDDFTFNTDTYDFEAPTVAACTTTNTVKTTDLSSWYLGETRANGHNELTANGLHVYTDGNSDTGPRTDGVAGTWNTDKAAGYYTTNFALADAGTPSITFANYSGGRAGLQLGVDKDNNGTWDGYLVYEPWAYGDGNYWSNKDFGVGAGAGYPSFGTLNQYLAANPNARVTSIGYSLGSGVQGDQVISKITAGCTDYTFGLAPVVLTAPTNLLPANGSYTTDHYYDNSWSPVAGATTYEYQWSPSDATDSNGALTGPISWTDSGAYDQSTPGKVIRHNGYTKDDVLYWQVRAKDASGNPGPWSVVSKLTVDSTAPSVPTNGQPRDGAYKNTNDFYFTWDASTDANPIKYEFQSSGSNAVDSNGSLVGAWNSIANGNSEQDNLTTPQIHSTGAPDGHYYWQVRAYDAAGNKSAWSTVWDMNIDTQAPAVPAGLTVQTVPGNQTVANGGSTNSYSVNVSWGAVAGADHYVYKVWTNIPGNAYNGEANAYIVDNAGTSRTGDFNQGQSTYTIEIQAVDAAGNKSAWSAPYSVTYDDTNPSGLANLSPANGSVTTTANQVQMDWTDASDANGPVSYYYESSNSSATNSDGSFASPVYQSGALATSQIPTPGTPEGVYYWHVRAVDASGNSTAWTDAWKVTVDNTAPSTPVATPGAGTYNSSQLVSLSSTDANGPTTIYYTTDGSAPSQANGTLYVGAFTVNSSETVRAVAYDKAGNISPVLTADYVITPAANGNNSGNVNGASTTNNTTITFSNTNNQTAQTGNANNSGNTNGGNAQTGNAVNNNATVLGASTTTPESAQSTSGQTKGDSTVNLQNASDKKTDRLFGLGWWWLAVLAALLAGWFLLVTKRSNQEN